MFLWVIKNRVILDKLSERNDLGARNVGLVKESALTQDSASFLGHYSEISDGNYIMNKINQPQL